MILDKENSKIIKTGIICITILCIVIFSLGFICVTILKIKGLL